jgi:hypothetical protein
MDSALINTNYKPRNKDKMGQKMENKGGVFRVGEANRGEATLL